MAAGWRAMRFACWKVNTIAKFMTQVLDSRLGLVLLEWETRLNVH